MNTQKKEKEEGQREVSYHNGHHSAKKREREKRKEKKQTSYKGIFIDAYNVCK